MKYFDTPSALELRMISMISNATIAFSAQKANWFNEIDAAIRSRVRAVDREKAQMILVRWLTLCDKIESKVVKRKILENFKEYGTTVEGTN